MSAKNNMRKAVYKLNADCGRMGTLEGLFVAEEKVIEWIISSEINVYFGEVLGKHSEIYGALSEKYFTKVSDKEEVIRVIEDFDLSNGFNPLGYTAINAENIMEDYDDLTIQEIYDAVHKEVVGE
mgnify:CR=1 FL=1